MNVMIWLVAMLWGLCMRFFRMTGAMIFFIILAAVQHEGPIGGFRWLFGWLF